MRKKLLMTFMALCMLTSVTYAQDSTVNGTVKADEDGTPLPGVTIIIKGTTKGTTTDVDGKFALAANSNDVLVFSYIGYVNQEITVGSQSTIDVRLKGDATQLSEVIVTAFGESTKKDFTGSASVIGSKDLALRPVTNAIAAIEGNATGVQFINSSGAPGSSPELVIRGVGTLNGGTTNPLFIVDGVQFEGSLSLINQDDIESMTILKDAASTSLYGSRAANGVVIITTKGGRKGQPLQVNFSTQFGSMSPAIEQYEATNPQQYYEVMWESYKNSLIADGVADPAAQASATDSTRPAARRTR